MLAEKKQLRAQLRAQRRSLSPQEVTEKSRLIAVRLFSFLPFHEASTVVLYNADENEVITEAIWRESLKWKKGVYYRRITIGREYLEFVRRDPQDHLVPRTLGTL